MDLYLKDESTHPTGSLKHRLARSLFLIELHGGRCHFVERPDHRTSGSRGRGWTSPRTWSGWRASWGAGNWGERRRSDGRDDEDGESALWGVPWNWLLADSYGPLFEFRSK